MCGEAMKRMLSCCVRRGAGRRLRRRGKRRGGRAHASKVVHIGGSYRKALLLPNTAIVTFVIVFLDCPQAEMSRHPSSERAPQPSAGRSSVRGLCKIRRAARLFRRIRSQPPAEAAKAARRMKAPPRKRTTKRIRARVLDFRLFPRPRRPPAERRQKSATTTDEGTTVEDDEEEAEPSRFSVVSAANATARRDGKKARAVDAAYEAPPPEEDEDEEDEAEAAPAFSVISAANATATRETAKKPARPSTPRMAPPPPEEDEEDEEADMEEESARSRCTRGRSSTGCRRAACGVVRQLRAERRMEACGRRYAVAASRSCGPSAAAGSQYIPYERVSRHSSPSMQRHDPLAGAASTAVVLLSAVACNGPRGGSGQGPFTPRANV